jgi:hypothetical protein
MRLSDDLNSHIDLGSAVRTAMPLSCRSDVEVMTHSILASLRLPDLFELQNNIE